MTYFKPGDRVVIKSWQEMELDYGLDADGAIDFKDMWFSKMMDWALPKDRIIWLEPGYIEFRWYEPGHFDWHISKDMIAYHADSPLAENFRKLDKICGW